MNISINLIKKSVFVAGMLVASSAFAISPLDKALLDSANGNSKGAVKSYLADKAKKFNAIAEDYENRADRPNSGKGVLVAKAEAENNAKAKHYKALAEKYKKAAASL